MTDMEGKLGDLLVVEYVHRHSPLSKWLFPDVHSRIEFSYHFRWKSEFDPLKQSFTIDFESKDSLRKGLLKPW